MKKSKLKSRLVRDRPMKTISLRFPVDVIDDLKGMAPLLGFSGYQPLIRAYVSKGLRADLDLEATSDVTQAPADCPDGNRVGGQHAHRRARAGHGEDRVAQVGLSRVPQLHDDVRLLPGIEEPRQDVWEKALGHAGETAWRSWRKKQQQSQAERRPFDCGQETHFSIMEWKRASATGLMHTSLSRDPAP